MAIGEGEKGEEEEGGSYGLITKVFMLINKIYKNVTMYKIP